MFCVLYATLDFNKFRSEGIKALTRGIIDAHAHTHWVFDLISLQLILPDLDNKNLEVGFIILDFTVYLILTSTQGAILLPFLYSGNLIILKENICKFLLSETC